MPSTSLSVEMTGEEARLFQSFQNVIRQAGKFEQSLNQTGQAAQKLSREEQAMAREAKRAFDEARPPLEKYNQAKRTLDGLLAKNKISQEEYNAALRKSKAEMDAAGQSGEKAFGTKSMEGLKSYVLGIASVTAAIALVKGGLQEVLALGEEAAARARGSIQDIGQLRQVATSQEDFETLVAQTRKIQELGVEETRAAQIVFAGRSAGMSAEDTQLLGKMEGTGFVGDTASMARNVKALQQAMGLEETGGFRDIVGKSLAASGGAPAAAEQILQASAVAAGGLGNLKMSDEELLAAVAQVSNVSGADQAGTQVRSLLFALGEAQAKGEVDLTGAKGLMDMVGVMEGMGLDDAALQSLLGRKEAIAAYRLLSRNREGVAGLRAGVDTAVADDLLGTRMAFGDESLDAAIAGRALEEREKVSRTEAGMGVEAELVSSMLTARDVDRRAMGDTGSLAELNAMTGRWMSRSREFFGRAGELENLGEQALRQGQQLGPEQLRLLNENRAAFGIDTQRENAALDKLLKAAEAQERAAENLHRATQAGPALVAPGEDR